MFSSFFQGYNLLFSDSVLMFFFDWFHGFNYSLLIGVLWFVCSMFIFLMYNKFYFKFGKEEYQKEELLCSIIPSIILLFQMLPSVGLLYYFGLSNCDFLMTLKVIGHQWYWSYDYSDFDVDFDSYMKMNDSLVLGDDRLLDVDNRCVLPVDLSIRFCITSADVIHAWSLSSMGVKLDAMSGILSVLNFKFSFVGVFFGQCSEICGANHSFMPIVVEVTTFNNFIYWLILML